MSLFRTIQTVDAMGFHKKLSLTSQTVLFFPMIKRGNSDRAGRMDRKRLHAHLPLVSFNPVVTN